MDEHRTDSCPAMVDTAGWPEPLHRLWEWLRKGVEDLYDPAALVGLAAALERICRSISAAQVRLARRLREVRLAEREDLAAQAVRDGTTIPPSRRSIDRGVGGELALSRRQAPRVGSAFLKLAGELENNLPRTLAALTDGWITEAMARIVATETQTLCGEDRQLLDLELGDHYTRHLSEIDLRALVRSLVYQLDGEAALERRRLARRERRVTCRPLPDGMARLSAEVPTEDAVTVMATLHREADAARADPHDARSRGQVMADELVERVSGSRAAEHDPRHAEQTAGPSARPPVELRLVVPLDTAFEGADTPALLNGEPLPAYAARDLITDPASRITLRRLFTHPETGQVIGMESTRRLFADGLRDLVASRDLRCRNPFCGAPIRHVDHVRGVSSGGSTSFDNAQGLCEYCNYLKETPGWSCRAVPSRRRGAPPDIELVTPTGDTYTTRPPRLVPDRRTPTPAA